MPDRCTDPSCLEHWPPPRTPINDLLTPASECRVVTPEITMHWYPSMVPGEYCYCGQVRSETEEELWPDE